MLNVFKEDCAHVLLKRHQCGETDIFEAAIAPSRTNDRWIVRAEAFRQWSGKRPVYSERCFPSFEEAEKALRRHCQDRLRRGFVVEEDPQEDEVA